MKLIPTDQAPAFQGNAAFEKSFQFSDYQHRTLLLSFLRFAGCPVCNLHTREMIKRYSELQNHSIDLVLVYHSSLENIHRLVTPKMKIPFTILADPNKTIYQLYGVEKSPSAMRSIKAIGEALRAVSLGFIPDMKSIEGGQHGLPADFLIQNGIIKAAHYGRHGADHLSIDQVLNANKTSVMQKEFAQ